ncbi:hypothetical protein RIF29_13386 [Crotalaria pallida]|uniref:Alpha/beta hydrolase fold-3 domain-containing protein n=1 Tax=Crotalaria pallida TaxID=3830 RepID=A0AAN9P2S4_CROPI
MSHPQSKEEPSPLVADSTVNHSQNQDPTSLYPDTPTTLDTLSPVLTKDVPLNPNNNTFIRLFLPHKAVQSSSNSQKLPLIVYYHGGGFVYLRASSSVNHDFCFNLAKDLSAVVASVDYRLAPAARLPAAYDDGVEALKWLSTTDEKWVREYGDVSKSYVMGTSAGGNLAYHVGLRVSTTAVDEFGDLKIRGLILHHPFFGGTQRTESELRLGHDEEVLRHGLSLSLCDMMWELALPEGVDRDHKYSNPTVADEGDEKGFDQIKRLGLKILVTGCYGDLLISRIAGFVEMLKSRDVDVEDYFGEGYHGLELLDPSKVEPLFTRVKNLIYKC